MIKPDIKTLIKGNRVYFDRYRANVFYYRLYVGDPSITDYCWEFTVPAEDIGESTLLAEDKAITFMRWIRQALDNNTLIKIEE